MTIDDVIKRAERIGLNEGEIQTTRAEYEFHLSEWVHKYIPYDTGTWKADQLFQQGKEIAEARANAYVNRVIDGWHKKEVRS